MGSPRQTFAGETRLTRQCRWPRAAEGRSASHFKIYPSLLEQPRPCLSPQARKEKEKEEDAEKLGQSSSSEKYFRPHPTPNAPNSPRKREKALSKKYEKLVVSRSEDSSYFCTKLTDCKNVGFQGFPNTQFMCHDA